MVGGGAMKQDFEEYVRELCRRATTAEDENELEDILTQLRAALGKHMSSLRGMVADYVLGGVSHPSWNDAPESDAHSNKARQPYLRRERDSAEGFVTWVRLLSTKSPGSSRNLN